jgi:hypothetical protein
MNNHVDKFGEPDGNPISNKETILEEINLALGKNHDQNPSIEYLITKPYGLFRLPFGLGSFCFNWFGHSALRYTTPNGRDIVVNIEAKENGKNFIQIYDAKEYLFGTNTTTCGAQRGIYQRDIVGLRVENVPLDNIIKMHKYIEKLQLDNNKIDGGDMVKFNIVLGPIINIFGKIFSNIPEYGNCARWTSAMLFQAGLTTKYYVWPKTLFINIFENYSKTQIKKLDNMNVIYYEQPEHISKPSYGVKDKPVLFEKSVAPFQSVRNYFYGDLKHFAKIIVFVPNNQTNAKILIKPEHMVSKPNELRNILNSKYFIITSVISSIVIYKKGFKYIRKVFI